MGGWDYGLFYVCCKMALKHLKDLGKKIKWRRRDGEWNGRRRQREGKARVERREKGIEREENRRGRGRKNGRLKNGRVGKEIKLLTTLYTPALRNSKVCSISPFPISLKVYECLGLQNKEQPDLKRCYASKNDNVLALICMIRLFHYV